MLKFILFIVINAKIYASEAQVLWPEQLTGAISKEDCLQHFPNSAFLSASLDGDRAEKGIFNLFYFSNQVIDTKRKTILYVDGGPGQVTGAYLNTLRFSGHLASNVIYFHPRAAGCSSLPLNHRYDQYIRNRYIVSDLEALRTHLGIQQWDIIFGVSAGTTVALSYAEKFPSKVGQLVLEGLHNPGVKPQGPIVQGIMKGFPSFLSMLVNWPEFSVLDDENKLYVINLYNQFFSGNGFTHTDGSALSVDEMPRFFGLLFQLSYYGVEQEDDFNKPLAMMVILQLLSMILEQTDVELIAPPSLIFNNTFAMTSYRSFLVHMSHDGLSYDFVNFLRTNTSEAALLELAGTSAQFIGKGQDMMTETMPRSTVPFSVPMTIFQGDMDGATPLNAALPMLEDSDYQYHLYELIGHGHSRHFSDKCYELIFENLMARTDIETLFKNTGGACFLKSGYEKHE